MNENNNILLLDPTENNQEIIQERGFGLLDKVMRIFRGKPKPKPRRIPRGPSRRVNLTKTTKSFKDQLKNARIKAKIKELPKNIKNWILKNKIKSGFMTWALVGEYINDFERRPEVNV